MRRATGIVLAVAAIVAGCGEDEDGAGRAAAPAAVTVASGVTGGDADRAAIVDVLDRYARAVRARDTDGICRRLLSADAQAGLEAAGASCAEFLRPTVDAKAEGYTIAVTAIRVTGDRATVDAREGSDGRGRQELVKEDGRWLLALPGAR